MCRSVHGPLGAWAVGCVGRGPRSTAWAARSAADGTRATVARRARSHGGCPCATRPVTRTAAFAGSDSTPTLTCGTAPSGESRSGSARGPRGWRTAVPLLHTLRQCQNSLALHSPRISICVVNARRVDKLPSQLRLPNICKHVSYDRHDCVCRDSKHFLVSYYREFPGVTRQRMHLMWTTESPLLEPFDSYDTAPLFHAPSTKMAHP